LLATAAQAQAQQGSRRRRQSAGQTAAEEAAAPAGAAGECCWVGEPLPHDPMAPRFRTYYQAFTTKVRMPGPLFFFPHTR
jgi:hypothetical protein